MHVILLDAHGRNYRLRLSLISLSFIKLSNDLSPFNFFLTVNSALLQSHYSGFRTTTPLKLIFARSLLSDTQQLTNPNFLLLLFLILRLPSTCIWWTIKSYFETSCGIKSIPSLWPTSYLSDRTHTVISCDSRTTWVPVYFGVPKGSVLGPLLFSLLCWHSDFIPRALRRWASFCLSSYARGHLFAQLLLASKIGGLSRERLQADGH